MAKKKNNNNKTKKFIKPKPGSLVPGPNQWLATEKDISASQLAKSVQTKYRRQHTAGNLSKGALEFIECNCNPFGTGVNGGYSAVAARIPDGRAHTKAITLYGTAEVTGTGAHDIYFAQLMPPNNSSTNFTAGAFGIVYGNKTNDLVAGVQPLAGDSQLVLTNNYAQWLSDVYTVPGLLVSRWRPVGGAIRAYGISNANNTEGVASGYLTRVSCLTGTGGGTITATAKDVAVLMHCPIEESRSITAGEGMTVRMPVAYSSSIGAGPTHPESFNADFTHRYPCIRFAIGNGTKVRLEFVLHLEIETATQISTVGLSEAIGSPDLFSAIAFTNSEQLVVAANSFKSFMKGAGDGIRKIMAFYQKHKGVIDPVASQLLSFV